jgi:hypothetical protein
MTIRQKLEVIQKMTGFTQPIGRFFCDAVMDGFKILERVDMR